jgi:phosphoesterase RecJ-like protein
MSIQPSRAARPEGSLPPAKTISLEELRQRFLKAAIDGTRVLLLAGRPIDGDSLASALALRLLLKKMKVECDVACGDRVPSMLRFLPTSDDVVFAPDFLRYGIVVTLDCGEIKQTGFVEQIVKIIQNPSLATLINLDHHLQQPIYGHFAIIDHVVASTGMIIFNLLQHIQKQSPSETYMDQPTAINLLATLYYDTGSFQHSNTSAAALRMAAECVRYGADASDIAHKLYRNKSIKALKLWGRALSRLEYRPESKMALSVITLKDLEEVGADIEEAKGIVNIIAQVPECRFALLLTEEEGDVIKGSLRSDEGKDMDVSRIARVLGGGGHKLSSGFRLKGRLEKKDGRYVIV